MHLVRDVLDAQLVDRDGQGLGRVDGILLRLRDGAPPRFVAMEVGAVTLARRVHPRVARAVRMLIRWLAPIRVRTTRYSPQLIRDIGVDIEVDVTASEDPRLLRVEKWLSRHIVSRIPGGRA